MTDKEKNNGFLHGIPPWVVIGSVIILLPIFVLWTIDNINRQKDSTTMLLLEKGAALIRSFEERPDRDKRPGMGVSRLIADETCIRNRLEPSFQLFVRKAAPPPG